jgi:hypothetical protein
MLKWQYPEKLNIEVSLSIIEVLSPQGGEFKKSFLLNE